MSQFVVPISSVSRNDIENVGKYAGELGELHQIGIPIPDGFIITSSSLQQFLAENNLRPESSEKQFVHASFPQKVIRKIVRAYGRLSGILKDAIVVVTSSSPFSSLNNISYEVKGDANLILRVKSIWEYECGKKPFEDNISIVVQKKIESKKTGIIFTQDPHSPDETVVHIKHKSMVSHYAVSKGNLDIIFRGHLSKAKISHKISDNEAIALASIGKKLEEYFRYPQEVKFAIDKNKIYVLETKSLIRSIKKPIFYNNFPEFNHKPKINHRVFLKGISSFPGIATGQVKVVRVFLKGISSFPGIATGQVKVVPNLKDLKSPLPGEIIVTSIISTDSFPIIKKIGGIIAENVPLSGNDRVLYSKIVARPLVFSVKNATKILHNGNIVTVDGGKGEIYKGGV